MEWILKNFDALSLQELYAILQLRNEVFVVEQQCIYADPDNKDQQSWHLMGFDREMLVAYTRIMPAGVSYPLPAIGRVVTAPAVRNKGLGRELMQRSLEASENLFGKTPVKISAQVYLEKFYRSLGFVPSGQPFLEDGIEHIVMIRDTPRIIPK